MSTIMEREPDAEFEAFLTYLSTSRNFDFTAYKRPSLMRRVQKRMQALNLSGYDDYADHLEVHPDEFTELFNTILINVTSFFRDPQAWEYLQNEVVPRILKSKPTHDPIRVWSAGCASGEEAYSLAMILAETMGVGEFRQRVKIYATDVDEDALNTARQGAYTPKDLSAVPEEYRDKYFEQTNGRASFRKDLRRTMIFGRHDLLNDAPISRVDLLVCRNTLMYLNSEGQARILARFLFALNNGGFLFLGKAETLLTYTSTLMPVDLKLRIFTKTARPNFRDRLALLAPAEGDEALQVVGQVRLRDAASENDPMPQMIVDANGFVAGINERVRTMFGLSVADVGRPLQDLELSYRPIDLRSLIDRAHSEQSAVTARETEWTSAEGVQWLDIGVIPLPDDNGGVMGFKVIFTDVTRVKELDGQLQQSRRELDTAYQELQSTNEELETTNEELQSTVEELETTNEELQSTNEELETMNEELQSTNEELETVNSEMREGSKELTDVNAFLESILSSLRAGVVVLDPNMEIQAWNAQARELWGLNANEVRGTNFLNLDIGLPVQQLSAPVQEALGNRTTREVTIDATNRRGRAIHCRVTCTPLSANGNVRGVILVMEQMPAEG